MKKLFKCSVCGFICEGLEAPEKCPKCGVDKEKFVELTSEEADKIYKSDRTNDIHLEIINLADKIFRLSREGLDINLDPTCAVAFEKAKNTAWTIKQISKAELAAHMNKGKW